MGRASSSGGGSASPIAAYGQAHQRRLPGCRLDPANKHHDTRAPRQSRRRSTAPSTGPHQCARSGGSLYWVIRGEIAAREKLLAIEPFRDRDGIGRCRLVMQPKVIAVSPRPVRPFQGWRYFDHGVAPPDLGKAAAGIAAMTEPLRRELRDRRLL